MLSFTGADQSWHGPIFHLDSKTGTSVQVDNVPTYPVHIPLKTSPTTYAFSIKATTTSDFEPELIPLACQYQG